MGALSPTHWLIIVGVLVLLFGAKRLPDAARSLGRSARILKAEVKETTETKDTAEPAETGPAPRQSTVAETPGSTSPRATQAASASAPTVVPD